MSADNSFLWTGGGWSGLVNTGMPHCCADSVPRKRRVLIVDDHHFFAACLRTLLDHEPDLSVCDIVSESDALKERITQMAPDLLVIDVSLGAESGIDVGRRLRALGTATPILFISTLSVPTSSQLAAVSSAAFMSKGTTPANFLRVLRGLLADANAAPRPAGLALAPFASEG